MGRSEHIRIHIILVPPDIIENYKLNELVDQYGCIYIEIIRGMCELPQAGILANNLITHRLRNHSYYQVKLTPGLWRHLCRSISFTLVVDDFEIGYVGR